VKQIEAGRYQAAPGETITLNAPNGSVLSMAGLNLLPTKSLANRESFSFTMPPGRAEVFAFFPSIPNPQDSYLNISGSQESSNQYSINVKSFENIVLSFETDYAGPR